MRSQLAIKNIVLIKNIRSLAKLEPSFADDRGVAEFESFGIRISPLIEAVHHLESLDVMLQLTDQIRERLIHRKNQLSL